MASGPSIIIADDDDTNNHNNNRNDPFLESTSPSAQLPPSSPAGGSSLLHPQSRLLRPPTPTSPSRSMTDEDSGGGPAGATVPAAPSPFNFQTQVISTSPVKPNIGQRRGHRYKHSSISAQHQIFQEPPPRPPPVLPASLPVPTVREAWASMQGGQRARLYWCCCHAAVAVYIFFRASGSVATTALSHLVFFDVGSAAVCVAVEVLGNFEVWRRSSVRHPFGLQRAEVLAGFAMSVFLVFGGFDLLSHEFKHLLEGVGHHAPHHPHGGEQRVEPGAVDTASLAAAACTLVSAYGLRNHGRIGRVMRVPLPLPPWLDRLRLLPSLAGGGASVLANPFHLLTLCFSSLMLLLPLLGLSHLPWLDQAICAAIAVSMFFLGARLAVAHGLMLLMSYSGGGRNSPASLSSAPSPSVPLSSISSNTATGLSNKAADAAADAATAGVSAVVREIESEPGVARVQAARFWQVHYGLAMASLDLRLFSGRDDDGALSALRGRVARLVNNRLGEGYGRGSSLRWEVTVQTSTDGS